MTVAACPPQPADMRSHSLKTSLWVFAVSAVCALAMVAWTEQQRVEIARQEVQLLANHHAAGVERALNTSLSSTLALAALVRRDRGRFDDFDVVANEMLPLYPGVSGLALAPHGVISKMVPIVGNEKAIGHDLMRDPKRDREAILARDTGRLTLAGPFPLVQGGFGAAGRLPVFLNGGDGQRVFWGLVAVLIRFPEILQGTGLDELDRRGFDYRLWRIHPDTAAQHVFSASGSIEGALNAPVEAPLSTPNATWTLSVAPREGWHSPWRIATKSALALLLAAGIASLAWTLMELRRRQSQMQATLKTVPDLMFEFDADGKYLDVMVSDPSRLYRSAHELVGRRIDEMLPTEAAATYSQALSAARLTGVDYGRTILLPIGGCDRWFELSVARKAGSLGSGDTYIVLERDVTERRQQEEEHRRLALFDPLTQLPNRRLLEDRLSQAIQHHRRDGGHGAVLYLDLDRFKPLNDTHGHAAGDILLREVAVRLLHTLRAEDTATRVGGDEFVVLLCNLNPRRELAAEGALEVAHKLQARLAEPYHIELHGPLADVVTIEWRCSASIGVALFGAEETDVAPLIQRADAAMYAAKAAGRDAVHLSEAGPAATVH